MAHAGGRTRSDFVSGGRFSGSTLIVAFLFAFALYAVVTNVVKYLLMSRVPVALDIAGTIGGASLMGIIVWFLLRREEIQLQHVGVTPRLAVSGLTAIGGFWVGLNAVGIGIATATGAPSIGVRYDTSLLVIVGLAIEQYFFVGLVEEFAFRGYLQNRLTALFGGNRRTHTVLGIAVTSVIFAVMHLPNRLLVGGIGPGSLSVNLTVLVVFGVVIGVLYELTRNVFFVGFLHGTVNLWPLVIEPWDWPNRFLVVWVGSGVVLLAVTVWSYRQWVGAT